MLSTGSIYWEYFRGSLCWVYAMSCFATYLPSLWMCTIALWKYICKRVYSTTEGRGHSHCRARGIQVFWYLLWWLWVLYSLLAIQLRSSADSTQLQHEQFRELQVKCWTKFYGCCYEYQQVRELDYTIYDYVCVCQVVCVVQYLLLYCPQLMSQPVGVFEDPTTGLVCLFKEEMLSFMYPASSADCLALEGMLFASNKCVPWHIKNFHPIVLW